MFIGNTASTLLSKTTGSTGTNPFFKQTLPTDPNNTNNNELKSFNPNNTQQKKSLFLNQNISQTYSTPNNVGIFSKPVSNNFIANNNQNKGIVNNSIFKDQPKANIFSTQSINQPQNTNILGNIQKSQQKVNICGTANNTANLFNQNMNKGQLFKNQQNQPQGLVSMFQNISLNSANSLPDTLSQQLKYAIMSSFQKLQLQKNTLTKENQFLNKRIQNLENRNKELIDIVNNLVNQKSSINQNNQEFQNGLTNLNANQNSQKGYSNQINNVPNNFDNFANQIHQLDHPLGQVLSKKIELSKQNHATGKLNNFLSYDNVSPVVVSMFKQDNIQPMAFTQKVFITDDGYAIKALITFNAFYSIKFIVIEQIQNNNGSFIFNIEQIMKNPMGATLNQIQNKGFWFLFNPNSNFNVLSYEILKQIQPQIINAMRDNSQQWISLHFNMQKWLRLGNNPIERVVVKHPQWTSSNCEIILNNYLNFSSSSIDAKKVIKQQIQEWISQTQEQNKLINKNNIMYFDQTNGRLHMILAD